MNSLLVGYPHHSSVVVRLDQCIPTAPIPFVQEELPADFPRGTPGRSRLGRHRRALPRPLRAGHGARWPGHLRIGHVHPGAARRARSGQFVRLGTGKPSRGTGGPGRPPPPPWHGHPKPLANSSTPCWRPGRCSGRPAGTTRARLLPRAGEPTVTPGPASECSSGSTSRSRPWRWPALPTPARRPRLWPAAVAAVRVASLSVLVVATTGLQRAIDQARSSVGTECSSVCRFCVPPIGTERVIGRRDRDAT